MAIARIVVSIVTTYCDLSWKIEKLFLKDEHSKKVSKEKVQTQISESVATREIPWLRAQLRRFPYWASGHLELGRKAMQAGDYALAYASAQAVLQLKPPQEISLAAQLLLAQCYVRLGQTNQAESLLLELFRDSMKSHDLCEEVGEELAACYQLQGKWQQLKELLQTLPKERLSPGAIAALQHAEMKLKANSS